MIPGEYLLDENAGPIEANAGRRTVRVVVRNTGDRPVQVGSHFHFFEVNRRLRLTAAPLTGCASIFRRARRFGSSRARKKKSS